MQKFFIGLGLFAFIIGIVLLIDYLMWSVYTWVTAQIAPDNHSAILQPSFWLFVAIVFLLGWFGRLVFGHRNAKN